MITNILIDKIAMNMIRYFYLKILYEIILEIKSAIRSNPLQAWGGEARDWILNI